VKKENVIGKVIFTIPYIGYIGYFVRTPIGFTLLIIIPASLLITMGIRNIIKELKKPTRANLKYGFCVHRFYILTLKYLSRGKSVWIRLQFLI